MHGATCQETFKCLCFNLKTVGWIPALQYISIGVCIGIISFGLHVTYIKGGSMSMQTITSWVGQPDSARHCVQTMACHSKFQDIHINITNRNASAYPTAANSSGMNSSECMALSFSGRALPRTALVSSPGSGNTWMRHLLQQLSGIHTGAVYLDTVLAAKFPGEGKEDSSVIVIKTHLNLDQRSERKYDRAILLTRDVHAGMLAEYNRKGGGHTGLQRSFNTNKWQEFFKHYLYHWYRNLNSSWLKYQKCLYIVRYEDLMTNLKHELIKLATFLNIKGLSNEHLDCVVKNSEGHFKRPSHPIPSHLFTAKMNKTIASVKAGVDNLRKERSHLPISKTSKVCVEY